MVNVLAPICYLGINEESPLGRLIDTTFNLIFTTPVAPGISSYSINVSTPEPWFLTGIYVFATGAAVYVKPYDGEGDELFTDFFLTQPTAAGTDPFPILPPRPFQANDLIRFDVLDSVGNRQVEVAFRGWELRRLGAPGVVRSIR